MKRERQQLVQQGMSTVTRSDPRQRTGTGQRRGERSTQRRGDRPGRCGRRADDDRRDTPPRQPQRNGGNGRKRSVASDRKRVQWAEDKASASIDSEALSLAHRTRFLSDATVRLRPMVPSTAVVSGATAAAAVAAAPRATGPPGGPGGGGPGGGGPGGGAAAGSRAGGQDNRASGGHRRNADDDRRRGGAAARLAAAIRRHC